MMINVARYSHLNDWKNDEGSLDFVNFLFISLKRSGAPEECTWRVTLKTQLKRFWTVELDGEI